MRNPDEDKEILIEETIQRLEEECEAGKDTSQTEAELYARQSEK